MAPKEERTRSEKTLDAVERWIEDAWKELYRNHQWQRIVKSVVAVEITIILCLVTPASNVLGQAAFLAPVVVIIGNVGRRIGAFAEMLMILIICAVLGLSWSILGLYLSSFVHDGNQSAAYGIRAVFLVFVAFAHGFMRSKSPRLFPGLVFLILVAGITLQSPSYKVIGRTATQIAYPLLIGWGTMFVVNTCLFPETSAAFLGQTTIDMLHQSVEALRDAESYFVHASGAGRDKSAPEDLEITHYSRLMPAKNVSPIDEKPQNSSARRSYFGAMRERFRHRRASTSHAASQPKTVGLKDLTAQKSKLRSKLSSCVTAQRECSFELSISCLPPRDIKPISNTAMKKIVTNTIALIGACESKFALMGNEDTIDDHATEAAQDQSNADQGASKKVRPESSTPKPPIDDGHSRNKSPAKKPRNVKQRNSVFTVEKKEDLELVKPRREIEFADARLLRYLLKKIASPLQHLQNSVDRAIDVVSASVALAYDVPKLPSGANVPKGIHLQELDVYTDNLDHALTVFDQSCATALETAGIWRELQDREVDCMPRPEMFLISSFVLNMRQAASHVLDMLRHSRVLVERRQHRHGRKTIYPPHIKWRKWLSLGGEEGDALPEQGRKAYRRGTIAKDGDDADTDTDSDSSQTDHHTKKQATELQIERKQPSPKRKRVSAKSRKVSTRRKQSNRTVPRLRQRFADTVEWVQSSEDVLYAFKLTIAIFLVAWPAFVPAWNSWYSLNRGIWAEFQLIFVFEVAIGSTVTTFLKRSIGTTLGCLWGWGAFEAGNGNRIVCAIMIFIGLLPAVYVQMASEENQKVGVVSVVSMSVVVLSSVLNTVPGTATENFLKRYCAFLIGAIVALLLQLALFPVKARSRLVESLASAIHHIGEMEGCVAVGVEAPKDIKKTSASAMRRFDRRSAKAHAGLQAAETFLPFCRTEPRLKGSFEGLYIIYTEIIFVLHQITDKMSCQHALRKAYTTTILETLNPHIHAYRLTLHASIALLLFAVHEALVTKTPLPQFLPSPRLAHLRLVNRVREVVRTSDVFNPSSSSSSAEPAAAPGAPHQAPNPRNQLTSWNAGSAAQAEIVEYLEELVELAKLLVGANEFRSGMLTRGTYRDYARGIGEGGGHGGGGGGGGGEDGEGNGKGGKDDGDGHGDIPVALRRIQSRRVEERARSGTSGEKERGNGKEKAL
ncbi:MAG: hypothetical protein M1833_002680 [Piccolia ochrophora]|nr:MAG: hypothetical protein M1833_002680 [Piccolia ochrophora]